MHDLKPQKVRNILVTGAQGTIGTRLREHLAESLGIECVPLLGDLREADSVRHQIETVRPSHVLHFAAIVEIEKAEADRALAFRINAEGTFNVFSALASLRPAPWAFYGATSHQYAANPQGGPCPRFGEGENLRARNFYALTKQLGEQTAEWLCREQAVPLCIGRVFSVHDSLQKGSFLLPSIRRRLEACAPGETVLVRNGEAVRDFQSGAEAARRIAALMQLGAVGTYNVASGKGQTVIGFLRHASDNDPRLVSDGKGAGDAILADTTRLEELLHHA